MALLFEFSQSKYAHRQGLAPVEAARRGMAYLVAFQGWRVPGPRRSDGTDRSGATAACVPLPGLTYRLYTRRQIESAAAT